MSCALLTYCAQHGPLDELRTEGPVLFLDRDGVLILDTGYLSKPSGVSLLDGAPEMIRQANRAGVPVIVVTNQSGVGRNYFSWSDFEAVNKRIFELIHDVSGGVVDAVLANGITPTVVAGSNKWGTWRKPGCGMLLAARQMFGCDLSQSWLVGDKWSDIRAARRAGLAGAVHLNLQGGAPRQICRGGFTLMRARQLDVVADIISLMPARQEKKNEE